MWELLIALQLTEKSYTFPFKGTSLESITPNLLYVLPRQNWVEKSTFLLLTFLSFLLLTYRFLFH